MRILKVLFVFCLICESFFLLPGRSYSQVNINNVKEFKKNNPDGNKYEFIKSYIMALEYFKKNAKHDQEAMELSSSDIEKSKVIKQFIGNLKQANVNLRIARNLLKKFKTPDNGLILKTVDSFSKVCDEQTEFNNQEKAMLTELYQATQDATIKGNIGLFFKEYHALAQNRKQSLNKLLEASVLASKVLVSSQANENGELMSLGITNDNRERLLKMLDGFYGQEFEGEMRDGQTFLGASVAVMKKVLEDTHLNTLEKS